MFNSLLILNENCITIKIHESKITITFIIKL